jgi:hypothetical protein
MLIVDDNGRTVSCSSPFKQHSFQSCITMRRPSDEMSERIHPCGEGHPRVFFQGIYKRSNPYFQALVSRIISPEKTALEELHFQWS